MTLTLPYPPSINHYWRHARGRHYISEEGKQYRETVMLEAMLAGIKTPDQRRLDVSLHLVMPDKRRRDIDNTVKALLDALTHARVWVDDEQIDRLTVERGAVRKPGNVVVTIKPLSDVNGFVVMGDR